MTKKFVFRSNKYNVTHQDIQRGIEDRGYIDSNPNNSSQSNPLDKWYTYTATRNDTNVFPSSSVDISRIQIHDAINRLYQSLEANVGQLTIEKEQSYHVGYNFDKQKIFNYVEEYLLQNPSQTLSFTKDPQQFLINLPGLNIKNILIYQGGQNLTNTTLPLLKTNIGEKVGHHKDGKFERGLQGPFTEANVGGYKHRHQPLGTTIDRPERFNIADDGTTISFTSPVKTDLNSPYVRFSRYGFTKSAVNIKNIRISGSNALGNFSKNYEIVNGLHRRNQNLALVDQPNNFSFSATDSPYVSGTTDYGLPDRRLLNGTYNKSVYVNKFGSPGDAQSRTPVFMDAESEEYSAYNTVNYRNPSPRTYLKGFLSTPSYFGGYKSGSFNISASYQKTQRNNRYILVSGTTNFRLREDTAYISYGIPARDGGYSWIKAYTTGGNNPGLYVNGVDNDIIFITASKENSSFALIDGVSYKTYTTSSVVLDTSVNGVLRYYNIQFNQMWNYTPKKQLSQNYNPLVVRNKKQNFYADNVADPSTNRLADIRFRDSSIKDKHTNIINVYVDESGKEERLSYPFGQEYGSLTSDFYRVEKDQNINIYKDHRNIRNADKSKSLFSKLHKFDKYVKENNLKVKKIKKIILEEKIYPRSQNVYRNIARARNAYSQSWADSLDNRLTELTNSQGRVYVRAAFLNKESGGTEYKFSYWPMDADLVPNYPGAIVRDKSGELLQLDNINFYYTRYGVDPGLIVPSGSYFGARFGRNWNINRPANVVHEQAGKGPYHNSYENYYSDIKLIGQDCSVIPEYRISPKLDAYYSSNINLFDDSFNSLELTGTVIEDASIAVSTSSAFLEQRVNSDYIDLNSFMNKELNEFKLSHIKLTVKAVKKLLPYDEFYPQKRTLKLAQQFSSSYSSVFNLGGTQATFRTILTPMYAPGVAYNSIKAGVGMPFSVIKYNDIRINNYSAITSSIDSGSVYYQKLPWDTILYPYKRLQQISGSAIYDIDTDMRIDSTASILTEINYNVAYDYAANNFYSEVINFFKSNNSLTSLKSKPSSEWYFPDLTKKYTLDIVINKMSDYTTYSSLENYGPKPYGFHAPPWYRIGTSLATASAYNSDVSLSPSVFGAAGYSYARITFNPSLMCSSNSDYLLKGNFNIGDIIRYSTVEYQSSILGANTSSATIQLSDIVDIFNVSADGTSWQPRLNWECPTADLNFYSLSAKLTNSSGNDSGGGSAGDAIRGIWHQYAPISNNDKGLFLTVRDYIADSTTTGSLLDVVKFDQIERNKIGKISSYKEIQEALVIVPFYVDSCGEEKYFDIDIDQFENMYENNTGIVGDIKILSRKYVLPPSMDFIRIRDITGTKLNRESYGSVKSPCLIFSEEFSSILGQQDLADIWQGVMPSISTTAEVEYKEKEFYIGKYLKDFDFKLPDNTRFKIFKVKRRAVTNYQNIIDRTNGNDYLDISYGYNWPYDYCSLVEMSEVKAELIYTDEIEKDDRRVEDEVLNKKIINNDLTENSSNQSITNRTPSVTAQNDRSSLTTIRGIQRSSGGSLLAMNFGE